MEFHGEFSMTRDGTASEQYSMEPEMRSEGLLTTANQN